MKKYKTMIGFSLLELGFLYCIFLHLNTVRRLEPQGRRSILSAH